MIPIFLLTVAVMAITVGGVIIHRAKYGIIGAGKRQVGTRIVYVGVIIIMVVVKVFFSYY